MCGQSDARDEYNNNIIVNWQLNDFAFDTRYGHRNGWNNDAVNCEPQNWQMIDRPWVCVCIFKWLKLKREKNIWILYSFVEPINHSTSSTHVTPDTRSFALLNTLVFRDWRFCISSWIVYPWTPAELTGWSTEMRIMYIIIEYPLCLVLVQTRAGDAH